MTYDYFVIGQGIAGTMVSWFLLKKGKRPLVIDPCPDTSSSRVAGGIFDPVTGRKLKKTWKAEELFPFAEDTYRQLESRLNSRFYHKLNILKPFSSVKQQNDWMAQSADPAYKKYIAGEGKLQLDRDKFVNPLGGIEITGSGYVELIKFLDLYRKFLQKKNAFVKRTVRYQDINFHSGGVQCQEHRAKGIVFCEGIRTLENPWFNWIPLNPAKGEIITFKAPGLGLKHILHKSAGILPLKNDHYKASGTYEWEDMEEKPTEKGLQQLKEKLSKTIKVNYRIIDHRAGIRPSSLDIRPMAGVHPENSAIFLLNGLGSKGVTLAPYFASQLADLLEYGKKPDPEADINRFYPYYEKAQKQ